MGSLICPSMTLIRLPRRRGRTPTCHGPCPKPYPSWLEFEESKDFCYPLYVFLSLSLAFIYIQRPLSRFIHATDSSNLFTCLFPHHLWQGGQHLQTFRPRRPTPSSPPPSLPPTSSTSSPTRPHRSPPHRRQTLGLRLQPARAPSSCSEVMAPSAGWLTIRRRRQHPQHGRRYRNEFCGFGSW